MKQKLTLTEAKEGIFDFDLSKAQSKYEKDSKNKISMGKLKIGKDTVEAIFTGELSTNGYAHNKADWGETYSIGMRLDEDQVEALQALTLKVVDLCPGFEITDPLKDDIVYFKLKLNKDQKSFAVKSNIKLDPKKDAMISSGTEFTARCELSLYVSFDAQKAGVTMKLLALDFEQ